MVRLLILGNLVLHLPKILFFFMLKVLDFPSVTVEEEHLGFAGSGMLDCCRREQQLADNLLDPAPRVSDQC